MTCDPILIVGAGIVGLTLGQALKEKGIPFRIYERDPTPDARGQGWAITLHWALEYLRQIVPDETLTRIQAVQVDPDVARHDNGTFLFINLATGEPRFKIPPSARWRVSREGMRKALLAGIEDRVHWGKRVVGVATSSTLPDRVQLIFDNQNESNNSDSEERVTGTMVIGAEGSRSIVRRVLRPDAYSNEQLPIRFTGVAVDLTPAEIQPLRSMDPLLFQGCEPESGAFFWFSVLETPLVNGTAGTAAERFRAQVCMSWPVRSEGDEVASTDEGRLANMKRRAHRFTPFLRHVVQDIPEGTPVTEITLADWECLDWDNWGGKVTLAGDAAHAMTMYRGEAANHGLLDAFKLIQAIDRIYSGQATPKQGLDEYEGEMRKRTRRAVRLSRQACHDAHTWERLNKESAILTKRSIEGE